MIVLRPPLFKDRITVGCSAPFVTKFKGFIKLNKGVAWKVDDLAARLSLTGLAVGDNVIQNSNGLTYQYNGPSVVLNGVFVVGAGTTGIDAVYSKRGTSGGKGYYNIVGIGDITNRSVIIWGALGGILGTGWGIFGADQSLTYYSLDDVARPDQVTTWVSIANDDVPTVTSCTQGELVAGFSTESVIYAANDAVNGRNKYYDVLAVAPAVNWNVAHLAWETAGAINENNVAFPWQGEPSVNLTRNDIASEANWSVV